MRMRPQMANLANEQLVNEEIAAILFGAGKPYQAQQLLVEVAALKKNAEIATLAIKDAWEALSWAQKGVCINYRFPDDLLKKAVILYERYAAQAQDNCSLRDRAEAAEAKVARLEDVIWQRGA